FDGARRGPRAREGRGQGTHRESRRARAASGPARRRHARHRRRRRIRGQHDRFPRASGDTEGVLTRAVAAAPARGDWTMTRTRRSIMGEIRRPALAMLLSAAAAPGLAPGEAAAAGTGHVFVSNAGADSVSVLDGKTFSVVKTLPTSKRPQGM